MFNVDKGYLSKPELDNEISGSFFIPKIYKTYGVHFPNEKETKMIKVKIEHKKYTPEIEKSIVSDYVLNQCKINSEFLIIDMGVESLQEVTLT